MQRAGHRVDARKSGSVTSTDRRTGLAYQSWKLWMKYVIEIATGMTCMGGVPAGVGKYGVLVETSS